MPIDPTEPSPTATATDRRAFLARGAAGGALVATLASTGLAGGLGGLGLLGTAGAQEPTASLTITQEFAGLAAPLELAAAQAYQAALSGGTVGEEQTTVLRRFQRNHQDVAALLAEAMHPDADAPRADPGVAARFSPPTGSDETAVLTVLAAVEETMAATHLGAIGTFDDSSFAKTVAQVLAVEQQQAVALGRAGGAPLDTLTPPTATTDGALEPGQSAN